MRLTSISKAKVSNSQPRVNGEITISSIEIARAQRGPTEGRGPMYTEEIRRAVLATPRERLAETQAALWKSHAAGAISDDDAQNLAELIQTRKAFAAPTADRGRHIGSRPRSPASIERRRRTAAAGWLPPQIACRFTVSEAAALSVIACETTGRGRCELTVGEIAGRAGCCATVVRNALREARKLGLIVVEARRVRYDRNLPNRISIVSPEWTSWLRLQARKGSERGGCRFAQPTKHHLIKNLETSQHIGRAVREFDDANRKVRARR